ncbi:MAG: leader peptidase (prepilin peptidase) / N-methyltransferase [Mycobacterium sp.]|jgi:leader peptidase (prepilin peptidase)/N-methyltransferase|nr:leader peptidase (prepilin peptidase) / N-methyltransferase [Mycobacterium sp.]
MSAATIDLAAALIGGVIGAGIPTAAHHLSDSPDTATRAEPPTAPTPETGRRPHRRQRQWPETVATATITAIMLAVLTARLRHDLLLPATAITTVLAITAASVDLQCRRLPDTLVLTGAVLSLVSVITAAMFTQDVHRLVRTITGTIAVTAGLFILAIVTGGLGMGDVKAGMWMSVLAGWHSPTALIVAAIAPFLIQGALAAPLLLTRRATRRSELPFGPALVLAGLGALLLTT